MSTSSAALKGGQGHPVGKTMWDVLSWLFFIVFIAGLIVVGGLLVRGYVTGTAVGGGLTGTLFPPKAEKRLEVVDQANVDGRRRLVLIRRDDIEHLIMTGGPVDVVIETGIGSPQSAGSGDAGKPVLARAQDATVRSSTRSDALQRAK